MFFLHEVAKKEDYLGEDILNTISYWCQISSRFISDARTSQELLDETVLKRVYNRGTDCSLSTANTRTSINTVFSRCRK